MTTRLLNSVVIALALVANFSGCTLANNVLPANTAPTKTSDPLIGEYQYSGFDDHGVKIITGPAHYQQS